MKLLICSDSHDSRRGLLRAVEREQPDVFCFLGDGLRDAKFAAGRYPELRLLAVQGNCDYAAAGAPEDRLTELAGVRIYLCHGHRFGVKTGLERLERQGRRFGAQLVLFGHTHRPFLQQRNGLTLLNPGSIGDGLTADYAVAQLSGDGRADCQLLSL